MIGDERFLQAVEVILDHEGGYVNDPNDPGGETNFGITKRTYPDLDMKSLTRDDAIQIYFRDWWTVYNWDRIDDLWIATKVFDMAVNAGPRAAHELLQRSLHSAGQRHVTIDGLIGQQTIRAANSADVRMAMGALKAECWNHYRRIVAKTPKLQRFERGWVSRAMWPAPEQMLAKTICPCVGSEAAA